MTTVRFLERGGRLYGFCASGHAGYAPEGEDIVCAAVSALTQSALLGLGEVLKAPVEWSRDEGKGALSAFVAESTEGTELLLRTLEAGLRNIAGQYPDLVGIDYMQRRGKSC
jgi:uncharacterized protein YsxB (DUF464 family)